VKTDIKKFYVEPAPLTHPKGARCFKTETTSSVPMALGCANAGSCLVVLFPPEWIGRDKNYT